MGSVAELDSLERTARIDLAAAFRLAVRMDLHEGVCNHFTLMLPGGRTFLLNRYGLHWSEVSASNLLALSSVWGSDGGVWVSSTQVWAAGASGTVIRRPHAQLTPLPNR